MKVSFLALLGLACTVNAQYFSKGWTPGQPAAQSEPTTSSSASFDPIETPTQTTKARPKRLSEHISDILDPLTLLESAPVEGLLARFGVNITERVAQAKQSRNKLWDDRIPLITDENFNEVIVDEELTFDELRERVWAIIVTSTEPGKETISKFVDKAFDEAYNETVIAGDLSHVKWARVDYLNVTYLTTKWNLWRPPSIVVLQDRGQTLRFYQANQLRLKDGAIRKFLLSEGWKMTAPWSTAYSPGGDREWILHNFALINKQVYEFVSKIPRLVLMIVSGGIGSFFMGWFHKKDASASKSGVPKNGPSSSQKAGGASSENAVPSGSSSSSSANKGPTNSKKRKGKK